MAYTDEKGPLGPVGMNRCPNCHFTTLLWDEKKDIKRCINCGWPDKDIPNVLDTLRDLRVSYLKGMLDSINKIPCPDKKNTDNDHSDCCDEYISSPSLIQLGYPEKICSSCLNKRSCNHSYLSADPFATPHDKKNKSEKIVHPEHYNQGPVECIDAISSATSNLNGFEAFCTGSAIKYLWRWKTKNGIEDLEKAMYYIELMIKEAQKDGTK